MVVVIRKCSCCGREFATGVFGFRCEFCQDSFVWTSNGVKGKAHPPCRKTTYVINPNFTENIQTNSENIFTKSENRTDGK